MKDVPRARALVLRYGWNATVYQIVNPGIEFSPRTLYAIAAAFSGGSPIIAVAGGLRKALRQEMSWLLCRRRAGRGHLSRRHEGRAG